MGQPLAKQGDQITATDIHIVLVPDPPGQPVPKPLPHAFNGMLDGQLSPDVFIAGGERRRLAVQPQTYHPTFLP